MSYYCKVTEKKRIRQKKYSKMYFCPVLKTIKQNALVVLLTMLLPYIKTNQKQYNCYLL